VPHGKKVLYPQLHATLVAVAGGRCVCVASRYPRAERRQENRLRARFFAMQYSVAYRVWKGTWRRGSVTG